MFIQSCFLHEKNFLKYCACICLDFDLDHTSTLIGVWEGETHPYYPDDKFITKWKDTKIFIHETENGDIYIFGRGKHIVAKNF